MYIYIHNLCVFVCVCIYIYVIYKPRLAGVFHKYTTRVRSQKKFATDKPRARRARGLSVANFR